MQQPRNSQNSPKRATSGPSPEMRLPVALWDGETVRIRTLLCVTELLFEGEKVVCRMRYRLISGTHNGEGAA